MSDLIDNFKLLFANSASFRTWVGAADQAAALLRVHYAAVGMDEVAAPRPYVLLQALGGNMETEAVGLAAFNTTGTLHAQFVAQIADGVVGSDGEISVGNKQVILDSLHNDILAILSDIQLLGRSAGYPFVRAARITDQLELSPRQERAEMKAEGIPIDASQDAEVEFGLESGETA